MERFLGSRYDRPPTLPDNLQGLHSAGSAFDFFPYLFESTRFKQKLHHILVQSLYLLVSRLTRWNEMKICSSKTQTRMVFLDPRMVSQALKMVHRPVQTLLPACFSGLVHHLAFTLYSWIAWFCSVFHPLAWIHAIYNPWKISCHVFLNKS